MRILVVTSEWPLREYPNAGVFVYHQVEALRCLGVEVEVLHFRGRRNPLRYYEAFARLRYLLKKNVFDLIHAHFGQAGFICTLQTRIPVVVTFHGSDLFGLGIMTGSGRLLSGLLRSMSLIAARRADEVITVSERLSRELPRPSHIIPMGIDLSTFTPKPRDEARRILGWSLDERPVLFVGDPTNPIKRYWLASEAVALVAQRLSNVNLHVCHNQPQECVPDYMNASDVLLVTSLHESGPLIVREALACNLPIVAVDVGDVRERIGDIEGCWVCPNDQPEMIAARLVEVLQRRQRINGREAVQELDERTMAQKVLHVYDQAVSYPKRRDNWDGVAGRACGIRP